jgi:hypothetical protein
MRRPKNEFDASVGSPQLRAELDVITRRYDPDQVRRQLGDIQSLNAGHPHSIECLEAVDLAIAGPGQFNCYMYALNIHDSAQVAELLANTTRPLGNGFMRWLIQTRRLKPTSDALQINDIIVYCDEEGPKHAGRWNGAAVVSKWGLAHLWEHGMFEVPTRYGHLVRSYRGVKARQAEKWFADYLSRR